MCIKIKNLLKKPAKGGIPANDKNVNIIKVVIICKLYVNFNSFKDFNHFVSNKKKIKNTLSIIITYMNILKNKTEKLYSLKISNPELYCIITYMNRSIFQI
jgi:hypothetical protein